MKNSEIAEKIDSFLSEFEADKEINKQNDRKVLPYYHAHAYSSGRYVQVTYISYQHESNLTKQEAETYLAWLEAGNVGKHWKALEGR